MKFGKIEDISTVDFKLPQDAPSNEIILKQYPPSKTPRLYVGCTGWGMKEWVGRVYPTGTKAKDFLNYYALQFNTIELNTTHYRIPTSETIQRWKAAVQADFRFCPKIPQTISHSRDLGLSKGQLLQFCEAIQGLVPNLGFCFMQLPPHFGASKLNILEKFLDIFPKQIPLSIEVRHESWFLNKQQLAALALLLKRKNTAFVITDVAGRRDVLHQKVTGDTTIIRFVGNDLHPSDYSRIDAWVERLATWYEKGLKNAYFFTHQPDNLAAPDLASYLIQKAKKVIPGIQTRGPKLIQRQQLSLF